MRFRIWSGNILSSGGSPKSNHGCVLEHLEMDGDASPVVFEPVRNNGKDTSNQMSMQLPKLTMTDT